MQELISVKPLFILALYLQLLILDILDISREFLLINLDDLLCRIHFPGTFQELSLQDLILAKVYRRLCLGLRNIFMHQSQEMQEFTSASIMPSPE